MSVENEKRRSERVPFNSTVMFGITDPIFNGFAYDLSEEGICIYCKDLPRVGDRLVIEIVLNSEFITVNGEVRWTSNGTYGESGRFGILFKESPKVLKNVYRRIKLTKHARY